MVPLALVWGQPLFPRRDPDDIVDSSHAASRLSLIVLIMLNACPPISSPLLKPGERSGSDRKRAELRQQLLDEDRLKDDGWRGACC